MSLYVLRYGTERGKGDYVGVGTPSRQVDAAKWIGRLTAVRARDESRKRGYDVRLVRLRPRRTLIGYVVRLDGPGEERRWCAAMRTTPEQRADLRADVSGPWGRYMLAEDLRDLLDDLDEALAAVAALRAVAEAARARCRDAVPEWAPELRAALRAWEERSRG